jgi:hypothetical protein
MDRIEVERLGGFAGFGQPGSRLRSRGEMAVADLSAADRAAVDALFAKPPSRATPMPDGFRYRLTRRVGSATQAVEVTEQQIPAALRDCVRDELV